MKHFGGYRRVKRDGNHTPIVQALRSAGRSVVELHQVGKGVPDLLVGWGRSNMLLLEVKDPAGRGPHRAVAGRVPARLARAARGRRPVGRGGADRHGRVPGRLRYPPAR